MRASPCDVFPPLPKLNMTMTIFDLDPLSFTVSVLGLLGAVAATLNLLRQFNPKMLYLNFAELVAQSRNTWDDCEREGLLPVQSKRYLLLLSKLEIHEERVRQLMFVTCPTWNILTLVRAWLKSWNLVTWCSQVREFHVGLLTISEQQRRVETAIKRAAMAGVVADVSRLEEIVSSTTDSFIRSLGGGKLLPDSILYTYLLVLPQGTKHVPLTIWKPALQTLIPTGIHRGQTRLLASPTVLVLLSQIQPYVQRNPTHTPFLSTYVHNARYLSAVRSPLIPHCKTIF
ncbi:hypothetical protein B0H34DRAFT_856060 [Crassisporium funariophilum]|nr:hypothetical protein B0H34DRAFT_856060 [Crassisporium funariophilum]